MKISPVSKPVVSELVTIGRAVSTGHGPVIPKLDYLEGGGEMGARIRAFDWSSTALGPPQVWQQSLRTVLDIMLRSRSAIFLWWGADLIQFYNDAYQPILGSTKHPSALGNRGRETWAEIWSTIGPMIQAVMERGASTEVRDGLLVLERNGFPEEGYFDYAYSPIRDDAGKIAGVFGACNETTRQVIGDRRLNTLRVLGVAATQARSADESCTEAARVLSNNANDVPFALIYLVDETQGIRLAGAAGIDAAHPAARPETWPIAAVLDAASDAGTRPLVLEDLSARAPGLSGGSWPESPHTAAAIALRRPGQVGGAPAGVVVFGVSPRLPYDAAYQIFQGLVAGQIAASAATAQAFADAQFRADELAKLDRAKTAFFSNVRHEFRTPLTLMLGPLEGLLRSSAQGSVEDGAQNELQGVHRSCLRLLKLVNSLLDFSRIEAGSEHAAYQPVDLAAVTTELASSFRSMIERVRLSFRVEMQPSMPRAYIDREMWEKIVLNLLANAFKHTLEGEISIGLIHSKNQFELTVIDTGTGIPPDALPHLFERFYRVPNARARTHEGSGIGLSLVQELAHLHGGTVRVESRENIGSTFTVCLPNGQAQLMNKSLRTARAQSAATGIVGGFVAEALSWLPAEAIAGKQRKSDSVARNAQQSTVLVVDDNADMRDYLLRLLSPKYNVITANDGDHALRQLQEERLPDLILSDMMMPHLDGLGLLGRVRAEPRTREIPLIFLSARAGEGAQVDGLNAGADDYLVKPFSARELLARVGTHLKLGRLRQQANNALREADHKKDNFIATLSHELRNPLAAISAAANVLRQKGSGDTREKWCRDLIERQVGLMARLLDDLLDVSRIAHGKIMLHRETLNLASIFEQAIEIARPSIDASGHSLKVTLPPQSVQLVGDPAKLAQVFSNLLINAAKYTEARGQISLSALYAAGEITVKVCDSGIGIATEHLSSIFELFGQVNVAPERVQGGLGIGLSLVKGLVEMHGGQVKAFSEGRGKGSEFVVRLPASI